MCVQSYVTSKNTAGNGTGLTHPILGVDKHAHTYKSIENALLIFSREENSEKIVNNRQKRDLFKQAVDLFCFGFSFI